MSAYVLRNKDSGELVQENRRPKVFQEPGDAQWLIFNRWGQGAVVDFEVLTVEEAAAVAEAEAALAAADVETASDG